MRARFSTATGLTAATLLLLTGCFGGSVGTEGDEPSGPGGGVPGCLQGSWDLDEQALAGDLAESMSSSGTNVVSSEASGGVHLIIDGDLMTHVSDVTYTMTIDMGDGITMIVSQLQVGESSGHWAIEGDELVFSDWTNGIAITNDVTIGGQTSSSSIDLPAGSDGLPMAVTCDGDRLTTHPEASPFTSVWSRE